jgi:4-amino-4-deoxy-L-arabinose transferase-like glycosyltransferase
MVRAAAVAVFAFTWIFRWLTIDFTNDHFVHLSRARQILLGELPVRDFFDPGLPLHYFASAAALALSGQNLLGEAMLTVTLVALGAALTFYLAARLSGSMLLALLATFIAVVLFPRLYNYPKVFLYPLALVSVWHYANRRTTGASILLGVVTALATLFRLDHGLYVAIAVAAALVLANLDQPRMLPASFARVAAAGAVLVLPFFVFVQMNAGIPSLLADSRAQQASAASARVLALPFTSAAGVLTPANAMAWLYYTTVLVPVGALIVMLFRWRRSLDPRERVTIGAAIVMCLVIDQALMRTSPDSRLPDVVGPTVVLASWITASVVRAAHQRARLAVGAAATLVWLATVWSATTFGETAERLTAAGVRAGRAATAERFHQVSQWMHMRPIDYYAPPGSTGIRALTRYLLECTRPADRILAGSFEPQIFFYSERAFAGGQVYLKGGWHESREAQQLTVARLQRQRVPIVIIDAPTELEVQARFPLVYQYVRDSYREVARQNFGGGPDYVVFVKRDLPLRRTDPSLGLPCYR